MKSREYYEGDEKEKISLNEEKREAPSRVKSREEEEEEEEAEYLEENQFEAEEVEEEEKPI